MDAQLHNLSPLIKASEVWQRDPGRPFWLRQSQGRIELSAVRPDPDQFFATISVVSDLEEAPVPADELTVQIEWPSGRHALRTPESWAEEPPYIGRPYILGVYDCYTIVRDYIQREDGYTLPELTDTPERLANQWLSDGVFVTNEELRNWDRVINRRPGDVVLFSISRGRGYEPLNANHCGIYLGDDQFLHHLPNRASCIQPFDETWREWVVAYGRRRRS